MLEWEVDSQQKPTRQPLNLPPPSSDPTPMEQSGDMPTEEEKEEAKIDPTPMEQSDCTAEEGAEAVEAKTGVKRALSMSPQAGGESQGTGAVAGDTGPVPEIKRRNVALYSEDTGTQEEA